LSLKKAFAHFFMVIFALPCPHFVLQSCKSSPLSPCPTSSPLGVFYFRLFLPPDVFFTPWTSPLAPVFFFPLLFSMTKSCIRARFFPPTSFFFDVALFVPSVTPPGFFCFPPSFLQLPCPVNFFSYLPWVVTRFLDPFSFFFFFAVLFFLSSFLSSFFFFFPRPPHPLSTLVPFFSFCLLCAVKHFCFCLFGSCATFACAPFQ